MKTVLEVKNLIIKECPAIDYDEIGYIGIQSIDADEINLEWLSFSSLNSTVTNKILLKNMYGKSRVYNISDIKNIKEYHIYAYIGSDTKPRTTYPNMIDTSNILQMNTWKHIGTTSHSYFRINNLNKNYTYAFWVGGLYEI